MAGLYFQLPKPKIKLKLEESMDDDDDEMFNCTYHPTQFLTDTLNTSNNNGSTSDEDSTSSGVNILLLKQNLINF